MKSWFPSALLVLATLAHGETVWQQRNVSFDVPSPTLGIFSSNFTSKSQALTSFEAAFDSSKFARNGDTRYGATIARVWTQQRKTWPELILYPETAEDVSIIMQFYSAAHSFWGDDGFAISEFYLGTLTARVTTSLIDSSQQNLWDSRCYDERRNLRSPMPEQFG